MFHRTEDINHLNVYQYHFLDDLTFVLSPRDAFPDMSPEDVERLVKDVHARFLSAGWEGDGQIGVIWLPPFVGVDVEDTWGAYIWHVKQSNNGTSWIGSKQPLNFARLLKQNESLPHDTHVPVGAFHSQCSNLIKRAEFFVSAVERQLKALGSASDPTVDEIRDELLLSAQGWLVSEIQEFLDDCYLQVLIHVLDHGNSDNLKLGKFKANLDLARYTSSGEDKWPEDEKDDSGATWLTITSLIQDLWRAFKFEPFASKQSMLCKACEYKMEDLVRTEIRKHVSLRNCVQHHQRQVTPDSLKETGSDAFVLIGEDGTPRQLKAWDRIGFSAGELASFSKHLINLAIDFDKHCSRRLRSVIWVPANEVESRLACR